MYSIYIKNSIAAGIRYQLAKRDVSLFGCNEGWIPRLMKSQMAANQDEPYRWHIDISKCDLEGFGRTLIIDLKPNSNPRILSLYEVADVWGISDSGWTPIMLRLRGLYVEQDPQGIDEADFTRSEEEIDETIFSFLYLNGSINNGKLIGRWTPPRASPTNSALLWPEPFMHFVEMAKPFL